MMIETIYHTYIVIFLSFLQKQSIIIIHGNLLSLTHKSQQYSVATSGIV